MRPKSTLPTQPTLSTRSRDPSPCLIVALLREDTREIHRLRPLIHVSIGRSTDCDIYIDDTRISRDHAYIERLPDRIVVRARGRMRVEDEDVHKAVIRAGQRFELRDVSFIAMTEAMVCAHPHLDSLVGDRRTIRDLLAMPRDRHAILLGVFGAHLGKIAEHHHNALTGNDARFVDTSIDRATNAPATPDIEVLLPTTVNGRIFIDGRQRTANGRSIPPRLSGSLLKQLADRDQRTALSLGLQNQKDVDLSIAPTGYACFVIPPISDRIPRIARRIPSMDSDCVTDRVREDSFRHLVDTTFKCINTRLRLHHLHPDFVTALKKCPWSGDYKAFLSVLTYATCAWRNDHADAERFEKRCKAARLGAWLDEAELSWKLLRQQPPDLRVPTHTQTWRADGP